MNRLVDLMGKAKLMRYAYFLLKRRKEHEKNIDGN